MNKKFNLLIIILIVIIIIYIIFINYNKKENFSVCGEDDRTFVDDTIIGFCNELCNDPDICAGLPGLTSPECQARKLYCEQECPDFARERIIKGGKIAGHYVTKAIVHNEIYNQQNIDFIGGNWIIVEKEDFIQTVGQNANDIGSLEIDLKNKLNSGQVIFTREYINGLENEINLFSYVDKTDSLDGQDREDGEIVPKCFIVNRSITETYNVLGDKFRIEHLSLIEANRIVGEQTALIAKINQALASITESASCNVEASALKWNNTQNNVITGDYIEYTNLELANKIKEKSGDLLQTDLDSLSISNLKYNNVIKVFEDDGSFNYWRPVLPKRLENHIKVSYTHANDYQVGSSINDICTNPQNGYIQISDGENLNMIKNNYKDKYLADSKTIGTKWKVVEKAPYLSTYGGSNMNTYSIDLKNKLNSGILIFTKEYIESLSIQLDIRSYFDMDSDSTKIYVVDFDKIYYSIDDIISERIQWNNILNSTIENRRSISQSECAYTKQQISDWGNQFTPSTDNTDVSNVGVFGKVGDIKILSPDGQTLIDNPTQYSIISDYTAAKTAKVNAVSDCAFTNSNKQNIVNQDGKIIRQDNKEWVKEVNNADLQTWQTSSYPADVLSKQYIHKDIINSKESELTENIANCKYTHDQVRNWKGSSVKSPGVSEIIPNFGSSTVYDYGLLGDNDDNYQPITKYARLSQNIIDTDSSCAFTNTQVQAWNNVNKPIININSQNITYGLIGTIDNEYGHRQTILDDYNNNCAYKKIIPPDQSDSTKFLYKTTLDDPGAEIDLSLQDTITNAGNTWGKFDNTLSGSSTINDIKTNNLPYVNNGILSTSIASICKSNILDDGSSNKYVSKTDRHGIIGTQNTEYRTMGSCNIKKQNDISTAQAEYQSQLGTAYAPIAADFQGYTQSETAKWNKLLDNQMRVKARMESMKQVCDDNKYQLGESSITIPKKEKDFYRSIKFIKDNSYPLQSSSLIQNTTLSSLLKQAPANGPGSDNYVDSNNIYHISETAWNGLNPRIYNFTQNNYIETDNGYKFRLATVNEYIPGLGGSRQDVWNNRFSKYDSNKTSTYTTKKQELTSACEIGYNWINADQCSDPAKSCIYSNFKTEAQKESDIISNTSHGEPWYDNKFIAGQQRAHQMKSASSNGIYYKLYGSEWSIHNITDEDIQDKLLASYKYTTSQSTAELNDLLVKLIEKETLLPVGSNIITIDYNDIIDIQNLLRWNGYFEQGNKVYIQTNIGENCNACAANSNKDLYINRILQTPAESCTQSGNSCLPVCNSCNNPDKSCKSNDNIITQNKKEEGIVAAMELGLQHAETVFLNKYDNGDNCVNYSYIQQGDRKEKDKCYTNGVLDSSKSCSTHTDSGYLDQIAIKEDRNQKYSDYCSQSSSGSCSSTGIENCA
jgi:hypothetical protein